MKSISERSHEIAILVRRRWKAMEEEKLWQPRPASFSIKHVNPADNDRFELHDPIPRAPGPKAGVPSIGVCRGTERLGTGPAVVNFIRGIHRGNLRAYRWNEVAARRRCKWASSFPARV